MLQAASNGEALTGHRPVHKSHRRRPGRARRSARVLVATTRVLLSRHPGLLRRGIGLPRNARRPDVCPRAGRVLRLRPRACRFASRDHPGNSFAQSVMSPCTNAARSEKARTKAITGTKKRSTRLRFGSTRQPPTKSPPRKYGYQRKKVRRVNRQLLKDYSASLCN